MPSSDNRQPPHDLLEALRSAAHPLLDCAPDSPGDDLAPVAKAIGDARVVGVGPPIYGSAEFIRFTHRLTKYLVENRGFRALVIEASMPDCIGLDNYLRTGKGDPEALLHDTRFWLWDMEEFLALIQWMRSYNREHGPILRLYGADSQLPRTGLEIVLQFLNKAAPHHADSYEERLSSLLSQPSWPETQLLIWRSLGAPGILQLAHASKDLVEFLERSAASLIAKTNAETWDVAYRCALNIRQFVDYYLVEEIPGKPPRVTISIEARERSMVDNLLWIMQRQEGDAGLIFLSHALHVVRKPIVPGLPSAGGLVADTLGPTAYFAIGCEFSEGNFWARPTTPKSDPMRPGPRPEPVRIEPGKESSMSDWFKRLGIPGFTLETQRDDFPVALSDWLGHKQNYRFSGGNFDKVNDQHNYTNITPADHFDLIAYFEKIGACQPNALTRKRFEIPAMEK